jgi:hypothetical protein
VPRLDLTTLGERDEMSGIRFWIEVVLIRQAFHPRDQSLGVMQGKRG